MLSRIGLGPSGAGAAAVRTLAIWPYLLVFGLGCLAYAPAAGTFFLKDDLALSRITDALGKPDVRALVDNFLWPVPGTYPQVYRPVPILLGWMDLWFFGADPAGFRVCNIGFHALNGVLLAMLVNQLTGFRRPVAGLLAGALFALHPLHGEAVLWITQRMVVLCATFTLFALIAFDAWCRRGGTGAAIACAAASVAAALTKEVTVGLPAVMVVMALLRPGPGPLRLRRALVVAAFGAGLVLLVVVPRRFFFGDWIGTYTNLTPREYAAEFRVFERLPRSLIDGLWAVNSAEVPPKARLTFGIAWLAFLAVALLRLVPALRDAAIRRAAAAFATLAVASFLPTLLVFWVEPTLLNGRFLYQPLAGVIGLLLAGFAREPRSRPLLELAAPAALVVLFALALKLNLRAYAGADVQIRAVRDGIQAHARAVAGRPVVVVYGSPTSHHGVVTLDLSLALAMRPPFTAPPGLDVVPLVAGLERTWAARVPEIRALAASGDGTPRPLLHLVAGTAPDRVSPLVGHLPGPSGESPPLVLAPADGAVLAHPDEEPTFVFEPVPGATRYRLRFSFEPRTGLEDVVLELDPARHLKRAGTRVQYRFGNGHAGDRPMQWREHRFENPLAIAWSIEALDAGGRPLGRSAARALVLLTARVPGA